MYPVASGGSRGASVTSDGECDDSLLLQSLLLLCHPAAGWCGQERLHCGGELYEVDHKNILLYLYSNFNNSLMLIDIYAKFYLIIYCSSLHKCTMFCSFILTITLVTSFRRRHVLAANICKYVTRIES